MFNQQLEINQEALTPFKVGIKIYILLFEIALGITSEDSFKEFTALTL